MKVRIWPCAFNTHSLKVYAIGDAPKGSVTLIYIPEIKLLSGFGLFIRPFMNVLVFGDGLTLWQSKYKSLIYNFNDNMYSGIYVVSGVL